MQALTINTNPRTEAWGSETSAFLVATVTASELVVSEGGKISVACFLAWDYFLKNSWVYLPSSKEDPT